MEGFPRQQPVDPILHLFGTIDTKPVERDVLRTLREAFTDCTRGTPELTIVGGKAHFSTHVDDLWRLRAVPFERVFVTLWSFEVQVESKRARATQIRRVDPAVLAIASQAGVRTPGPELEPEQVAPACGGAATAVQLFSGLAADGHRIVQRAVAASCRAQRAAAGGESGSAVGTHPTSSAPVALQLKVGAKRTGTRATKNHPALFGSDAMKRAVRDALLEVGARADLPGGGEGEGEGEREGGGGGEGEGTAFFVAGGLKGSHTCAAVGDAGRARPCVIEMWVSDAENARADRAAARRVQCRAGSGVVVARRRVEENHVMIGSDLGTEIDPRVERTTSTTSSLVPIPAHASAYVLGGVLLLRRASSRGDIQHRGLHPSVAWAMAKLLKLRNPDGDTKASMRNSGDGGAEIDAPITYTARRRHRARWRVLDPMCGNGVCGIELLRLYGGRRKSDCELATGPLSRDVGHVVGVEGSDCCCRGLDVLMFDADQSMIETAARQPLLSAFAHPDQGLDSDSDPDHIPHHVAQGRDTVIFQHVDCTKLSVTLGTASVDGIVCDLPFGKKFGSIEENVVLYPAAVVEMVRVLRPACRLVLLTSAANQRAMDLALAAVAGSAELLARKNVRLGCKMHAFVFVLLKSGGAETEREVMADTTDIDALFAGASWSRKWLGDRESMTFAL